MSTLIAKLRNNDFELVMSRDAHPQEVHYGYEKTNYSICPLFNLPTGEVGTWISLSRDGSIKAILDYGGASEKSSLSPEQLLFDLLHGKPLHELNKKFLLPYDPFQYFSYDGKHSMNILSWNGVSLEQQHPLHSVYLTSSIAAQEKKRYIIEHQSSHESLQSLLQVCSPPLYLDEVDIPEKTLAMTRIHCTPQKKLFHTADHPFLSTSFYECEFS